MSDQKHVSNTKQCFYLCKYVFDEVKAYSHRWLNTQALLSFTSKLRRLQNTRIEAEVGLWYLKESSVESEIASPVTHSLLL